MKENVVMIGSPVECQRYMNTVDHGRTKKVCDRRCRQCPIWADGQNIPDLIQAHRPLIGDSTGISRLLTQDEYRREKDITYSRESTYERVMIIPISVLRGDDQSSL